MTPPDAGRTTTTDELIAVPEAPPELRRRRMGLRAFLTYFGPGAIIASLTVGSGESILASREGAVFGYAILWAVIIGAIAKGALVYASNRYITVVGEHPMTRFARVFPGPRGWFAVLLAVICFLSFPGWASGLAVALGGYLEKLGAGNGLFWAIGLLLIAAAISFAGGYGLLEKTQIAIVAAMVVLVLVAVFVVDPDWGGVLGGFVPGGFDYAPWVGEKYADIASTSKWI
jgi:Mn2+/Fe2+ NRAMP family transporter